MEKTIIVKLHKDFEQSGNDPAPQGCRLTKPRQCPPEADKYWRG
ncbi:MAG: hypothetical protein NTW93_00825 [Phycisphaerae bacterium]|nr:hypothetical protein [Phycisphaerae bacterium]